MSDQSKTERKRPNVSSISLLNLKSLVTQNTTSNNNNNNIEKPNEYQSSSIQENDEIENKKRKTSRTFPNPNDFIEYLTTPTFKTFSNRRIITSEEYVEQSIIQSPLKRIVIPRTLTVEKERINHDTRIVISKDEQQSYINSNDKESTNISLSSNIHQENYSNSLDCFNQYEQSIKNNLDYWDSFHISIRLRDAMMNISKRLIKIKSLSIVDTHCHFDLIFDRLCIRHNNIKKYFDDYKDLYPTGLSFELAIHVYWRPRHITEKNWINWYSNYLNDERVYGSCGIHPHWSSSWSETIIEDIERCLQHPKIIAIGEIGLDLGPKNTCDIDQQCRVFGEQLKLAKKWLKPVVIHCRDAYKQTFDVMKQYLESNHKIHLHCFVGTIDDVHLFTSYFNEIKFGFTPMITRTNFLHQIIQQLDLTQILSETDSPYFVPEELSNLSSCAHPSMVYSVIETIALIRQLSVNDVACQLRKNVSQIYGV